MKELERVRERIEARKERSAWGRGVKTYAHLGGSFPLDTRRGNIDVMDC